MSKNNKKKRNISFFEQQLQQNGPGWIYRMNTDQVRKQSLRVIKDIAFGNFDPYEVSEYFAVADFTYNVMVAADDNTKYNWYTYIGLLSNPATHEDPAMVRVMRSHYEAFIAYQAATIALNNILTDITINNGAFIPALLMEAIRILDPYKHFFNGYFITLPRTDDTRVRAPRREIGGNQNYGKIVVDQYQNNFWGEPDQNNM